ncbi:type III secretion system export apparatus subunit SctU [Microbulbifer variabilis]|uniref:type III secretion system export apparatus subunit SctU n=1 Tax=Microbulbifer variabilis TaxID=266805 RepID=UPI001CFF0DB8|nr:type III secretion system export apparatus subunit SctU [Microbulbifer variabilis]
MTSSKTEPPTPKKIRDAREKGQVAKSKEVVSLVLLVSVAGYFWLFGEDIFLRIKNLFHDPSRYIDLPLRQLFLNASIEAFYIAFSILAPILAVVFVFAIVSNVMQTGWIFSSETIIPKFEKIGLINGAKKIFSAQNAMEFIKSLIKIIVLTYVAWYVLKDNIQLLMQIPVCGAECAIYITGSLMMKLILYCLAAFVFLAGADFGLERFLYFKKLRMSIDEVRREYKDTEGNPEIKGRRKEIHRELMSEEVVKKRVSQADVLITNPVHFAVGIRYDQQLSLLPFVTIKGEMIFAKKLRNLAIKNGIPIVENVPLARSLYAKIDLDQKITDEFVEPVADIIRWLRSQDIQT